MPAHISRDAHGQVLEEAPVQPKPAQNPWNIVQRSVNNAPLLHEHSIGLLSQAISLNTIFCFGAHLGARGDGLAMQSAASQRDHTKEQLRIVDNRRRRIRSQRRVQHAFRRIAIYSRCVGPSRILNHSLVCWAEIRLDNACDMGFN